MGTSQSSGGPGGGVPMVPVRRPTAVMLVPGTVATVVATMATGIRPTQLTVPRQRPLPRLPR